MYATAYKINNSYTTYVVHDNGEDYNKYYEYLNLFSQYLFNTVFFVELINTSVSSCCFLLACVE